MFNKLLDGTPAQKLYSTSKLNRFTGNEICYDRSRVAAPSKVRIYNKIRCNNKYYIRHKMNETSKKFKNINRRFKKLKTQEDK